MLWILFFRNLLSTHRLLRLICSLRIKIFLHGTFEVLHIIYRVGNINIAITIEGISIIRNMDTVTSLILIKPILTWHIKIVVIIVFVVASVIIINGCNMLRMIIFTIITAFITVIIVIAFL